MKNGKKCTFAVVYFSTSDVEDIFGQELLLVKIIQKWRQAK